MKLLVSVKDIEEFKIAFGSDVDIIDLKDPEKGPLAAVSPQIASAATEFAKKNRAISPSIRNNAPVDFYPQYRQSFSPKLSLAMGELMDMRENPFSSSCLAQFSFAKVGLAGLRTDNQWSQKWSSWALSLPSSVTPVLVGYADWEVAQSPNLDAVIDLAIKQRVEYLLIDTYSKNGQTLLDHLPIVQLQRILEPLQAITHPRTNIALAGSVGIPHLQTLLKADPQIIAARGSVCENANRKSIVCKQLIDLLSSEIRNFCGRTQKTV